MANNLVVPSIARIFWLLLKAIEFNGDDTTSFLKNFVVLMYLFIFDILKLYCKEKKKNPIAVKKLFEKFSLESLMSSTLFSLNFLIEFAVSSCFLFFR